MNLKKYTLPISVFLFVALMLSMVQLKVDTRMILLDRFFTGGGWIEIISVSFFGAFLAYKMQNPASSGKWRRISWIIFSIWFFTQLILGIAVSETFLLTGKLHLPVPAMLIGGPIYRGEKSVMTILFLSTIVLTGPAWCSQFCYFGAIDNLAAKGKTSRKPIKNKSLIKHSVLLLIIIGALVFRWLDFSHLWATLAGIAFGILGIVVIIFFSRKQKRMVHCSTFCPVGTVVNYLRIINPFRMYIDNKCDECFSCSSQCKYDALNIANIRNKKPGFTCTLCGDCVASCKSRSINYKFPGLSPKNARTLYLFFTISIYTIFLALGRT